MVERRNRKRIEELAGEIRKAETSLWRLEQAVLNIITPYLRSVEGGNAEDVPKLVEIRQAMLVISYDHMFRMVVETLKGKDTSIEHIDGNVGEEVMKELRFAATQYDYHRTLVGEAQDRLVKYVKHYVCRRDKYDNIELLNELIGLLPDCQARYNLMASREYKYRMGVGK